MIEKKDFEKMHDARSFMLGILKDKGIINESSDELAQGMPPTVVGVPLTVINTYHKYRYRFEDAQKMSDDDYLIFMRRYNADIRSEISKYIEQMHAVNHKVKGIAAEIEMWNPSSPELCELKLEAIEALRYLSYPESYIGEYEAVYDAVPNESPEKIVEYLDGYVQNYSKLLNHAEIRYQNELEEYYKRESILDAILNSFPLIQEEPI